MPRRLSSGDSRDGGGGDTAKLIVRLPTHVASAKQMVGTLSDGELKSRVRHCDRRHDCGSPMGDARTAVTLTRLGRGSYDVARQFLPSEALGFMKPGR